MKGRLFTVCDSYTTCCGGDTDKCTFYPEKRKAKSSSTTKPTMTREKAEALLGVKIID